jgi:hypothetical protein
MAGNAVVLMRERPLSSEQSGLMSGSIGSFLRLQGPLSGAGPASLTDTNGKPTFAYA